MDLKPQDVLFIIVLIALLFKRDSKLFVWAGLASLLLSIPLFATWTFFTAQRLVIYAFAFFLVACIFFMTKEFRTKKND